MMKQGGYRTGAGRPAWKQKAESLPSIDIRDWARQGLLEDGQQFGWTAWGAETVALIHVSVAEDHILLAATMDKDKATTRIALDRTPCNYGGERVWLRCPSIECGQRVAKLYVQFGRTACRDCFSLLYQSQSISPQHRALVQAGKIRSRLGGSPAIAMPFPERPRGMHRKIYRRLMKKCALHEGIALGFLSLVIQRMQFG